MRTLLEKLFLLDVFVAVGVVKGQVWLKLDMIKEKVGFDGLEEGWWGTKATAIMVIKDRKEGGKVARDGRIEAELGGLETGIEVGVEVWYRWGDIIHLSEMQALYTCEIPVLEVN